MKIIFKCEIDGRQKINVTFYDLHAKDTCGSTARKHGSLHFKSVNDFTLSLLVPAVSLMPKWIFLRLQEVSVFVEFSWCYNNVTLVNYYVTFLSRGKQTCICSSVRNIFVTVCVYCSVMILKVLLWIYPKWKVENICIFNWSGGLSCFHLNSNCFQH